jgi:soluble lytic murein transglycosylase-like protein
MTRSALLAAALCLGTVNGVARADVFEVGADGAMVARATTGGPIEIGDTQSANDPDMNDAAPEVPAVALTMILPPAVPVPFQPSLTQAAERARISPSLLAALVWQESRWRAAARSSKGARGLTQLMPGTARALAVDPADADANLAGGARYLRTMLDMFDGNVERALAAYNAGPGRVRRTDGLPAISETRAYVASIIDRVGALAPSRLAGVTP